MPEVTADMMITLDGYASGEGQSLERPFGDIDTDRLEAWRFDHAEENAEEIAAITAAGAYISEVRSSVIARSSYGWYGGATPHPQRGTGALSTTSAPGCEFWSARREPHSA